MHQGNIPLDLLIPLAIELGFNALKADHGFFIEVLKHWHDYSHSQAAQILEKHFFEVGLYNLVEILISGTSNKSNINPL